MLRLIAIISMTLDHAALLFIGYGIMHSLPAGSESFVMWNAIYTGLRSIGRMAFPIFALLLVQGYERTKNFRNYALRLALLALVSEIPFDWVVTGSFRMYPTYQNTVYTLLIGLLTIRGAESANEYLDKHSSGGTDTFISGGLPTLRYVAVWAVAAVIGCGAARIIGSDYNWEGVALILLLYLCRRDRAAQCLTGAAWCIFSFTSFIIPYVAGYAAAFLLIYFYRGDPAFFRTLREKGGILLRWVTYLYYPAHLMVLWGIYCIIFR